MSVFGLLIGKTIQMSSVAQEWQIGLIMDELDPNMHPKSWSLFSTNFCWPLYGPKMKIRHQALEGTLMCCVKSVLCRSILTALVFVCYKKWYSGMLQKYTSSHAGTTQQIRPMPEKAMYGQWEKSGNVITSSWDCEDIMTNYTHFSKILTNKVLTLGIVVLKWWLALKP